MSIEYSVICNLDFIINVKQLLDVLVVVLHVFSLAYVADYRCVEAFTEKLQ
jgi:hypothetical protein